MHTPRFLMHTTTTLHTPVFFNINLKRHKISLTPLILCINFFSISNHNKYLILNLTNILSFIDLLVRQKFKDFIYHFDDLDNLHY